MDQLSTQVDYEFEGYRLDTVLQVLVSPSGEPIALPARAYDALRYLLEGAGELIDKATLMRAVWPKAVVEENNLNQCILTLRRALGESAGERRFILTVPGRGFKFVAPVRAVPAVRSAPSISPPSAAAPPPVVPAPGPSRPDRDIARVAAVFAAVLLAAIALAARRAFITRSGPVAVPTEYQPLTDLSEPATEPVLSPDGRALAFIGGAGSFLHPGRIYVKLLPDGEATPLTPVLDGVYGPAFSPDGSRIAFTYAERQGLWDTWMVPATGGQPAPFLANAAGLTWIASHELLYSEIKSGIHLAVVTSAENRAGRRDIYLPAHERGMAHYSHISPDRRSVLVVEMGPTGAWERCRVVPFDGSSRGTMVGPQGPCTSAAWSPDGRWMYFSAMVGGHTHLWRQAYPRGTPEQITFGPTDEEGVSVAPDGRSLVTSLGLQRRSIWIHDASGERRITSEAVAADPWLSSDAKRLYYLAARISEAPSSLMRLDISQGRPQPVLPDVSVLGYDISPDEREVAFSVDHEGERQVWVAPLDHHLAPRLLARSADEPHFDGSGHVFFRKLGDKVNHLYRMREDGTARERVLDTPILDYYSVSPKGGWAAVLIVIDGHMTTAILRLGGESFRWTREGYWPARWAADGRTLYLEVEGEKTLAIPLPDVEAPPKIPPLPMTTRINLLPSESVGFSPGPDRDTYAFTRSERLQNIYRIPLHR